jgi:hypothetical protein
MSDERGVRSEERGVMSDERGVRREEFLFFLNSSCRIDRNSPIFFQNLIFAEFVFFNFYNKLFPNGRLIFLI